MSDFMDLQNTDDNDDNDIPTPHELLNVRREVKDSEIRRLRDRCLKALQRGYNGRDDVFIDIGGFDSMVVEIVAEQFNKKGWTCWKGSGRDGIALIFKAKLG
jgi:hypothetical protein